MPGVAGGGSAVRLVVADQRRVQVTAWGMTVAPSIDARGKIQHGIGAAEAGEEARGDPRAARSERPTSPARNPSVMMASSAT